MMNQLYINKDLTKQNKRSTNIRAAENNFKADEISVLGDLGILILFSFTNNKVCGQGFYSKKNW